VTDPNDSFLFYQLRPQFQKIQVINETITQSVAQLISQKGLHSTSLMNRNVVSDMTESVYLAVWSSFLKSFEFLLVPIESAARD
jgi:hypothetical protein